MTNGGSLLKEIFGSLKEKLFSWVKENFDLETLKKDGSTNVENESSVILYANIYEYAGLLTGDAGTVLNKAYEYK